MSQPFAIRLAEKAVREFFTRWSAGLQPCLLLETHVNGEILVSSRVSAPPHRHQTEQDDDQLPHHGHRHHRRPPGPARLRRRERRAHARAAAANAATPTKNIDAAAEKAVATQDAAVQAVVTPPQSSEAAVQVDCTPPYQEQTAVQAGGAPHQHHQPLPHSGHHAGQADDRHHPQTIYYHNDLQDMLCPDRDYQGLMRTEDEENKKKERQEDLENFTKMIENSFKS